MVVSSANNLATMVASVLAPSKFLLFLLSLPQPTSSSSSAAAAVAAAIDKSRHNLLHLLRTCLLVALHALLFLLRLASLSVPRALSRALKPNPTPRLHHDSNGCLPTPARGGAVGPGEEGSTYVERALSHVLEVVTRIPVSSRKYELARGLADRLLYDNVHCRSPALAAVNRAALASAFSRTLRHLEAAVLRARGCGKADGSVERILDGVRSRLRWWAEPAEEGEGEPEQWTTSGGCTAEKLAADALWLAEKMAACGAVGEAVERWGAAAGLAQLALASEPRLQGTFVRISAFLLKHANSSELGDSGEEEHSTGATSRLQMNMLTSWLPLLCRASNGTDAPVLSGRERVESVDVIEEMIVKLSWDQQEEVLALWLHNFAFSPDSDWPDLRGCYTRWYAVSRKLLVD